MRILITGAGGMLGHDVVEATEAAGHDAIALDRATLDIADPAAVRAAFAEHRPDAVVNCAAWTKVDAAETQVKEAQAVNIHGAGHLGTVAAETGAWLVHVSTDYVFDGDKGSPYLESDDPYPRTKYGRTKLDGERAIVAAHPHGHTIVRTAWLFGAHGPCFPATMLRLAAERDELTVVDDQVGSPTFTGHLAPALVSLAEPDGRTLGVLHVAAGGECSWCAFAAAVVSESGADTVVRPIPTREYPTPAPRPAYSVLRSERGAPELPDWRAGLSDYLAATARAAA